MIDGYENFTYIGYTYSDEKPTFYFAEGRYTQVHKNKLNEGWHPVKKNHRAANIKGTEAARFSAMKEKGDMPGLEKFVAQFLKGDFDSDEKTAKYFEYSAEDEKNQIAHVSRGRLVKVGDADFHMGFDEKYAKDVLKTGKIAANEKVVANKKEAVH
jgi:hypothetical protein